jgi:hypothetical protein
MARIDIDIEDYLDEVSTRDLLSELKIRKNFISEVKTLGIDILKEIPDDDLIAYLIDNYSKEKLIKKILCLREWHDKERIIEEIRLL